MTKNLIGLAFSAMLFALSYSASAQPQAKVPRIGFLSVQSSSLMAARTEAFRQGLRTHGYVDGTNIAIEWRYADGKLDLLPQLAAELLRLKVSLVVTGGPQATRAAKQATVTIPIVMTFDEDPVGSGFIASLARPGGNITGLSTHYPEISGKQLELIKECVPKLSRLAVIGNSTSPGNAQALKETEVAAAAFGVRLQYLEVQNAKEIETAFQAATKGRANAVLLLASAVLSSQLTQVADLAVKSRLPAIYARPEYVEAGGLMIYGVSINDLYRRAATYVDKILKGTKPAEIPVEQPTKFEFVINLKAAKQIGLTIPPNMLVRADRVIK